MVVEVKGGFQQGEDRLRELTAQYLEGEIQLDEFNEQSEGLGRVDLREVARKRMLHNKSPLRAFVGAVGKLVTG